MTITILSDQGNVPVSAATADPGALWLTPADAERATGWTMKPEGLCRGPVCIPVPPARRADFVRDGAINLAAFWRYRDAPAVASDAGDVWALGEPAAARAEALDSLEAPDFALPDIDGKLHRLSDYRGQKVLLATWASW
jgi:hypothetical protein